MLVDHSIRAVVGTCMPSRDCMAVVSTSVSPLHSLAYRWEDFLALTVRPPQAELSRQVHRDHDDLAQPTQRC